MQLDDYDIRQAVSAAMLPLLERIEALTEQVEALHEKLDPTVPTIAGQKEAAEYLGISYRTLQRRQEEWTEGLHWWRDSQSNRPIYNLTLIRDGQRQGFDSREHLKTCQQWMREQQNIGKKERSTKTNTTA
ncbi:MAG: hypothetical protein AAFU78_19370 [Cyanobacteria bacterium J06633_2]